MRRPYLAVDLCALSELPLGTRVMCRFTIVGGNARATWRAAFEVAPGVWSGGERPGLHAGLAPVDDMPGPLADLGEFVTYHLHEGCEFRGETELGPTGLYGEESSHLVAWELELGRELLVIEMRG